MAKLSKKKKLLIGSSNAIFIATGIVLVLLLAYLIFNNIVMG